MSSPGLAISYSYRLTVAVTVKSVWEAVIPLSTEVTLPPKLTSYSGERRHTTGFGKSEVSPSSMPPFPMSKLMPTARCYLEGLSGS